MAKLSEHFDSYEFRCKCGCGGGNPSTILISMLEKLFAYMDAKEIWVSSGYRCPSYSPVVGGFIDDAHTRNMAADIRVLKKDEYKRRDAQGNIDQTDDYTAWDVAEAAERVGFKGIGIIKGEVYCHLDTRSYEPYRFDFWYGNEYNDEQYTTFQRGTVFPGQEEYDANDMHIDSVEMELQTILKEKGYDLTIDGIIGNITLSNLRDFTIEPGDSGNLTRWTQRKLANLGYDVDINGTADQKMMDAIHQFQKDNKLGVGKNLSGGDWAILASLKKTVE